MSRYRELVMRMAADASFATHALEHADEVAATHGLTPAEAQRLGNLVAAEEGATAQPLWPRLSKSGTGGLLSGLHLYAMLELDQLNVADLAEPVGGGADPTIESVSGVLFSTPITEIPEPG